MSEKKLKKAIVLAASSGIGNAIARKFASENLQLAVCSRDDTKIQATKEDLERLGAPSVHAKSCNIYDSEKLDDFMKESTDFLGGTVDVLITNIGGPPPGKTLDHSMDIWQNAFNGIIGSVITATRNVIPGMQKASYGRIISIGSVSAKQYLPNMALSNCLRPALSALIKNMAMEFAGDNIFCFNIMPGAIMTQRNIDLGKVICEKENITMDELEERWKSRNPMKRMGQPDELGEMAWFLASPQCSFTSGISIPVDGGASTWW